MQIEYYNNKLAESVFKKFKLVLRKRNEKIGYYSELDGKEYIGLVITGKASDIGEKKVTIEDFNKLLTVK